MGDALEAVRKVWLLLPLGHGRDGTGASIVTFEDVRKCLLDRTLTGEAYSFDQLTRAPLSVRGDLP